MTKVACSYPAQGWKVLLDFEETKRVCALRAFLIFLGFCCFLIYCSHPRGSGYRETWRKNRQFVKCRCPEEGGNEREFLRQSEFDVCSIACTSGNRFASEVSEVAAIAKGYELMHESSVEICILCRDAVDLLPNLTRRIRSLSSKFRRTHLSVIENDSRDDTVEVFRQWARNEKLHGNENLAIDIEHHNLLLERPPVVDAGYDDSEYASVRSSRYHRLSLLRNRCLMQAMKQPSIDYFIVLDVDKDVDNEAGDDDGIAHSFGLVSGEGYGGWDVVCANSVLKEPSGVGATLYRNISELVPPFAREWVYRDSLAFRNDVFDLQTFRFHERRIHTPYDPAFFVHSCFGGVTLYNLRSHGRDWHRCSYEAFKDDDCEHVSFHNCLRELGWRVMFNPRMTVRYR